MQFREATRPALAAAVGRGDDTRGGGRLEQRGARTLPSALPPALPHSPPGRGGVARSHSVGRRVTHLTRVNYLFVDIYRKLPAIFKPV